MPILAEQILNTCVGLFDTFLAGRISAAATSAIGLAAYVDWLASMMLMLVGTGTTALVSRHKGAGDVAEANHFMNQSLILGVGLGFCVMILGLTLAPWFARYCNMTGEAFDITVTFLRIDSIGYVFASLTYVGCASLRGVGDMRTPMLIFATINVVNAVVSSSLVYGWGPFPLLGVNGIVCGTVTARLVGTLLTLSILAAGRSGLKLSLHQLPIAWARTWRILRIGLPAGADGAIMWSGHFLFLAIISRLAADPLGQAYFAAHIVAVRVESFSYLPAMAWAAATASMIGQALGAGDHARARRIGHEAVFQCGLLVSVIATGFVLGAPWIFRVMSADPLVREVGVTPLRFLGLLQPFLMASIVYVGGLRGAGDTRFPLVMTFVGTILIRLPLGYFFGIVLNGGLLGAWAGMFGDNIWRGCAAATRFIRGKWVHTVV